MSADRSESEFYHVEEETLNQTTPINLLPNFKKKKYKKIYVIYRARSVRMGKNCARGLKYGPRPNAR